MLRQAARLARWQEFYGEGGFDLALPNGILYDG